MKKFGMSVLVAAVALTFAGISEAQADCASDLTNATTLAADAAGCWTDYGICKVNPLTTHAECMAKKENCEKMDQVVNDIHVRCKK
jgi:hypothetical protein